MDAKAKELIRQEKEKRRLEREQKKKEQLTHTFLEQTEKLNIRGNVEQCSAPHLQLNVIKNAKIPNDAEKITQSLNYGEGPFIRNMIQEPSAPTNKESRNRNLKDQFERYTENVEKSSDDKEHLEEKIKKQKCHLINNNEINELSYTSDFISEMKKSDIQTPQNGNVYYIPKHEDTKEPMTYEADHCKEPNMGVDEDIIKNKETIEETYELIESDNEDLDDFRFLKNEESMTRNWRTKEIFFKKTEEMIKNEESSNLKMEMEEGLNERFSRNMKDFKINTEAENVEKELIKEGFSYNNFETVGVMDTEKFDGWFQDYVRNLETNALDQSAYYEEVEYLLQLLKDKKKKLFRNLCDDDKKNEMQKYTEEDILDELETFHKNVNTDIHTDEEKCNERDNKTKKRKALVYDIDKIYEELGIQKRGEEEVIGFSLNENEKEKEIVNGKENGKENGNEKGKENANGISEQKDIQKLPKGFFDDKEKKEFLKTQSDLAKIDEQIQFLENEKKILLQDYENAGFIYDEKINNYIDYLYDDEYENKEVIMQQIKEKNYKSSQKKGEHIRLIEEMFKEKKKRKEKKRE